MAVINEFGRRFDDLDAVKLRIAVRELAGEDGYAVRAEDGTPLLGCVPNEPRPVRYFVAIGWGRS